MGSHNDFLAMGSAKAAGMHHLVPPSAGGTINLQNMDGALVLGDTSSAENWLLPAEASTPLGTVLYVSNRSTGTITVKNQASSTVDTVADGEIKGFVLSADATWNALGGVSETSLAASTGAAGIGIADAGGHYASTNVENALQEIWSDLAQTNAAAGAKSIGIQDAGGYTSATTVEAALAEIHANLTGDAIVNLPLHGWREAVAFDVLDASGNGGVLASDTTPVLSAINDATDGCQRLLWVASNNDQIVQSVRLPSDVDETLPIYVFARVASGGTTDAVGFTVAAFFNEGDTAISEATTTNQTTGYQEVIASIDPADIVDGMLHLGLTPVAHTSDTMACTGIWLRYTRKLTV